MKKLMLPCVLALCACSGSEPKKEDVPAAAPVPLTTNDLLGTFNGTSMAMTSDSVVATWTTTVTVDSLGTARGKYVAAKFPADTIKFTQAIAGDSVITVSAPYLDRTKPAGSPLVYWKAVGHRKGDSWQGTTEVIPVGTDSVVARVRWQSTRMP